VVRGAAARMVEQRDAQAGQHRGCPELPASTVLGLSSETISSLRRVIHRKLGVRHRGELVRAAILGGYVRIASNVRSGLSRSAITTERDSDRGVRPLSFTSDALVLDPKAKPTSGTISGNLLRGYPKTGVDFVLLLISTL
jgi:hypothetical protein